MRISDWSSDVCSSDLSHRPKRHSVQSATPEPAHDGYAPVAATAEGDEPSGYKAKDAAGAAGSGGRAADRKCEHPATAGHDVRDTEAARRTESHDPGHRRTRGSLGRFRFPAFTGSALSSGSRRHLFPSEPGNRKRVGEGKR